MNCAELVKYLSQYIDNDLDDDLTAAAREHLATCANCHIVLDSARRTIALGRGLSARIVPADRREALFARIQAALAQRNEA
ncbi:MAG: zf-HC2 domain-containing protein [Chloroflexota bacterium]|nr:zf-HC2 domain-containing protein [Chloroflexota bacterium]